MSDKIFNLKEKFESNKFSQSDLNILKSLNEDELNCMSFIENEKTRNFLLKAYFITFQQNVYESAKKSNKKLDSIISEAWTKTALKNTSEEILDSYIGTTLINTNLLSIIRENILDQNTLIKFEKQVYDLYKVLEDNYNQKKLLNRIYLIKDETDDDIILSNMSEVSKIQSEKTLEEFEKIVLVWKNFILKTQGKDSSELDSKINSSFERVSFNFLPKQIFNQIDSIFKIDESEKIDFAEMIHMPSPDNNDIVIEDDVKIKKEVNEKTLKDSFFSIKTKLSSKTKKSSKKSKIRFKNKPEKKSGFKFVFTSVLILSAISISTVFMFEKIANNEPLKINSNIKINEGVEAKISIVDRIEITE